MEVLAKIGVIVLTVGGVLLALAALPSGLALFVDKISASRIRRTCEAAGCIVVEIKPYPNHYGVKVTKDGVRHYLKAVGSFGKIQWKGSAPSEL
jgi:hypothetical protein